MNHERRRTSVLGTALCVFAVACSGEAPVAAPAPGTPIVLVVVDTLRFDRTQDSFRFMPHWRRFADEGVEFRRALAASSWTGASVASIFTGVDAAHTGVRSLRDPLPESAQTLAEALRAAGYRTRAVVSNGVVGDQIGYGQGFDEFLLREYKREGTPPASRWGRPEFTAEQVTDEALARMPKAGERIFLYVHYTDPHDPYLAPHPYRDRVGAKPGSVDEDDLLAIPELSGADVRASIDAFRAHYDAEVAFVDEQIGRLLDAVPDDAFVALTSDHGDEFLEHGGLLHGRTLYQEVLRVPLAIRGPGLPNGTRIERPVSHIDIAPTLLELAGLPGALPAAAGHSLVDAVREPTAERKERRIFFATLASGDAAHATATQGRWKLYETSTQRLLFDLANDPQELYDVKEEHPQIAEHLQAALRAHRAKAADASETSDTAAEQRERALRNLGYID